MPLEYNDLPRAADERTTLMSFLDWQRDTFERKCEGLSADQLRIQGAPPSSLSLLGLARHLAEVERGWLRRTLGGEDAPDLFSTEADPDADFNDIETSSVDGAFNAWRAEIGHGREVVERHALDDIVKQRTGREVSMRWILTHLVEEYSRHNGHADLLREAIDGVVGY